MYPQTVVCLLVVILSFALIQYYFFVPTAIRVTSGNESVNDKVSGDGYWGSPNSDFDWCEYNYLLTQYIAEPWNSLTSLFYVIVAMIGNYYSTKQIPSNVYKSDLNFLGYLLIAIGCGSTLFHATLLYQTQLIDELPMYYLVSYAFVAVYTRNDYKNPKLISRKFNLYIIITMICTFITVVLWTTEKDTSFHSVLRLIESVSFVFYFIYLFYVCAICANQVFELNPTNKHYKKINIYYDKCFIAFIIALIGWLCDNFYCDILQNLNMFEFSIPYLHFHAFLWHIGTCIGLHYFFMVMLAHRVVIEYNLEIKTTTVFFGILPYIEAFEEKQKKTN